MSSFYTASRDGESPSIDRTYNKPLPSQFSRGAAKTVTVIRTSPH